MYNYIICIQFQKALFYNFRFFCISCVHPKKETMKFFCLVILLALGIASVSSSSSGHSKVDSGKQDSSKDEKDWVVKGGKKYMVHAEKKTHVEAAKFCAEKEASLLKEGSSGPTYLLFTMFIYHCKWYIWGAFMCSTYLLHKQHHFPVH